MYILVCDVVAQLSRRVYFRFRCVRPLRLRDRAPRQPRPAALYAHVSICFSLDPLPVTTNETCFINYNVLKVVLSEICSRVLRQLNTVRPISRWLTIQSMVHTSQMIVHRKLKNFEKAPSGDKACCLNTLRKWRSTVHKITIMN